MYILILFLAPLLREQVCSELAATCGAGLRVTKTCLFKFLLKILPLKNENFQIKSLIFFFISAQNLDCGYLLEPPRRGGSNEHPNLGFEQI